MSSRRCNSCASGYNWTPIHRVDHRRSTVPATVLATVRPPSRPTDLTTVFDRRSVGLLWRSEIIGTVGDRREVGAKGGLDGERMIERMC